MPEHKQSAATVIERGAALALGLIHLAALALFLAVTFMATKAARAETACTGTNLLQTLSPLERDKIMTEAQKTPNGSARLFRIDAPGVAPSWVFGTMHLADERVVTLPDNVQAALDQSDIVVIETTDILDPSRMMAVMGEQPELMMFTDATTLDSLIEPDELALVRTALEERGLSLDAVRKMKPWMLSSMLAVPACETDRKAAGAPMLDQKLATDAQAAGKTVVGLETAAEQLGAMASLPMDFHIRGLVDTLALGDRIDDVLETMISLYTSGDTGAIWPLFSVVLPEETGDAGYVAFEERMVTARNKTMADRSMPLIKKGGAFIAVGAMHLPGEEGVVELLRGRGLTLTAVE